MSQTQVLQYGDVATKIRAGMGKMLSQKDLEEMCAKPSVADVAAYLKESTAFGPLLESVNISKIHRGDLEYLFQEKLYEDMDRMVLFSKSKGSFFGEYLTRQRECENLKILLRNLHGHHRFQKDSLHPIKKTEVPFDLLASVESIPEFVELLRGTVYYQILHPLLVSEETLNMFTIEMALEHYFFRVIRKERGNLSAPDRACFDEVYCVSIEVMNVLWIYRCKRFFDMSPEMIFRYVVSGFEGRLTSEKLVQLIKAPSVEEFMSLIKKTVYAKIFDTDQEELYSMRGDAYMRALFSKQLRKNPYSEMALTLYYRIRMLEVRTIIMIIEGVRYGVEPRRLTKIVGQEFYWKEDNDGN